MTEAKQCIACGMPMTKAEDYPNQDTEKDYCIHCARPDGRMQSFEEKKAGMTSFILHTQGFDEKAAAKLAEETMKKLPAWQNSFD